MAITFSSYFIRNTSFIYHFLTKSEVIRGKSQTRAIHLGQGLRFPCNDCINKVNKSFFIWPFHYGPEPAISN